MHARLRKGNTVINRNLSLQDAARAEIARESFVNTGRHLRIGLCETPGTWTARTFRICRPTSAKGCLKDICTEAKEKI
jgi:hypothetical protein